MKARLLLNLCLLSFLLGLFMFIQFWPTDTVDRTVPISGLNTEDVNLIKVHRKNQEEIVIKRSGNTWRMVKPNHARVSEFQIDRVLEIVKARSAHKINDYDQEEFGFDLPDITLTINGQKFLFGQINQITNEQYLKTEGAAYLVAPHLGYSIPGDLEKFFSHKILSVDEIPTSIEFKSWKVVQEDNGSWKKVSLLPTSIDNDLSPDHLNQWVIGWKLTSSLTAQPFEGPLVGTKARVNTSSGTSVVFHIIKNERGHLFVREDEKMGYQLGEDAGNRLLDPFEVATPQS